LNSSSAFLTDKRSLQNQQSFSVVVDLGLAEGRGPSRTGSNNVFKVQINQVAGVVKFDDLADILSGQSNSGQPGESPAPWQQAITVLDHLIHQGPRQDHLVIKNSFFKRDQRAEDIGGGVKVLRGVFASIKVALRKIEEGRHLRDLVINTDATTCCFWPTGSLLSVIQQVLGYQNANAFIQDFRRDAKGNENNWANTRLGQSLQRLKRLRVYHNHRPLKSGEKPKQYSILGFKALPPLAMKFTIEDKGPEKNDPRLPPGEVTIAEYFRVKYGKGKQSFQIFPCVEMAGRGGIVPIEVCEVVPDQKYTYKLDGRQTSNILRLAAVPPTQRRQAIQNGFSGLKWNPQTDKWLRSFGVQVRDQMTPVQARLLDTPDILFGRGKVSGAKAKDGKWRLQGIQFLQNNKRRPIKSWACCALNDGRGSCVQLPSLKNFAKKLMTKYIEHGGLFVGNPAPVFSILDTRDLGSKIRLCMDKEIKPKIGQPDLLVFVVPDKSSDNYNQIKKICDCLFGVASQVCLASHVDKCQDEYVSNVCMKINSKLGGATSRIQPHRILQQAPFYKPSERVLIVGADVTHGAPGSHAPSVACLVMSQDPHFTRYSGMVEVNGQRQDIIHTFQMEKMFNTQLHDWMVNNEGKAPGRVLYFRDGVSREQCKLVIEEEVRDMKNCLIKLMEHDKDGVARAKAIKFTAIVCTKRHHARIFPEEGFGDRNKNSVPGTLVETGVNDGVSLDWILNSHVAIKGTARPMHYQVILDESNYDMEQLQQFIYEHAFQYARSTTPVSQFPAIYYAHLCSRRGSCHEDKALTTSSQKMIDQLQLEGMTVDQAVKAVNAQKAREAAMKLKSPMDVMMLPVWGSFATTMWYI
jgi:eukaryotic translation initiation factor 2C